ncbi:hypothetical protein HPC49_03450 [Pyxidicoccus fallax]|uniref:SAF domain-containing protein n=1 Tax=Pyxidicoccus fallax TaxID=394095 RepID=A0A848LB95_9BACT|nr:SAF domain-containing protein [Pyxidicoccus fallax]NMO15774.1 hypothetical protein [Pyxidicoccus fallax]NPC77312.1 hypothetical protein [Pyxidicoccus fallax]
MGLPFFGLVGGVVSYFIVKNAEREARRDWELVPVAVADRELLAREVVTFEDIARRSIPAALLTPSLIRPDDAGRAMNQQLVVPVKAGEPLRWSFLAEGEQGARLEMRAITEECQRAFDLLPNAPKPERTVEEIRERLLSGGSR